MPTLFPDSDALTQKGMRMHIEEFMLTMQYKTTSGGRPSASSADHLRHSQEAIMLVHLAPSGSKSQRREGFTVNTRVTTMDVYGSDAASSSATSASAIFDVPYEGKDVDIPGKAMSFLINRYCSHTCFVSQRNFCSHRGRDSWSRSRLDADIMSLARGL